MSKEEIISRVRLTHPEETKALVSILNFATEIVDKAEAYKARWGTDECLDRVVAYADGVMLSTGEKLTRFMVEVEE